jgi:hypothetical protein
MSRRFGREQIQTHPMLHIARVREPRELCDSPRSRVGGASTFVVVSIMGCAGRRAYPGPVPADRAVARYGGSGVRLVKASEERALRL